MLPLLAAAVAAAVAAGAGTDGPTRLERLRSEIERLATERDALEGRESGLLGEIARMDADLRLASARIEASGVELEITRADLAAHEREIAAVEEGQRRRAPRLAGRLRAIYERGAAGVLRRLLLPAGGPGGLEGVRYASYLAARDAAQLAAWREAARRLRQERAALAAERTRLAGLVDRETRSRQELAIARSRREAVLESVRTDKEQHERALGELRSAADALERLVASAATDLPAPALDVRQFRGLLDWPADGPVGDGFGAVVHPRFKTVVPHPGIDIDAPEGAPIRSVFDGRVVYAAPLHGYGLTAIVDHGHGVVSVYAHASAIVVSSGDEVVRDQEIGRVGDSGSLRGPYLYFELRDGGKAVDPASWLRRR